ncbi:unnamed protein product [Hydatigera taeniaeformis]|uniref:Protein xylosyltransferase n=1 Tax=Hydatigena taeniaeformis TaxID=6205 RepID=A0A0R3X9U6_HYDTA|nr:unnamed protein product [Hydatigera taeniaeformis]
MFCTSRVTIKGIGVAVIIVSGLALLFLQTWSFSQLEAKDTQLPSVRQLKDVMNVSEPLFFSSITSSEHPNCISFRQKFVMITQPDGDMNVAFTMVVHKDVLQIARLLRMIYRVNNYYCIHLDARSSPHFQAAMRGVATCFGSNVELVPKDKRIAVHWGDESVLRPQFICAKQALQRDPTWHYLVNIVGQEFPLKTNLELVAALKALNGSNLVEAFPINRFRHWVKNKTLPLNVSYFVAAFYFALVSLRHSSLVVRIKNNK